MASRPPQTLRIACLLPSATDICVALGLESFIVGVTHECNNVEHIRACHGDPAAVRILTKDGLNVTAQGDIHKAVGDHLERSAAGCENVPSLYPILPSELKKAAPTVVFTQDLCSVCAPSTEDVQKVAAGDCGLKDMTVVSLTPTSLSDVADTFVIIAKACEVLERGHKMRTKFLEEHKALCKAIETNRDKEQAKPSLLLLEWLDPPFDGGHWILQMMDYACVRPVLPKSTEKSQQLTWTSVVDADPDVVLVACCGFQLERNMQDALAARKHLSTLGAFANNSIYVGDGHRYFACPGPELLGGTAILARCAYQSQPKVLHAIDELSQTGSLLHSKTGWQRVDFRMDSDIGDMEDVVTDDFTTLHKKACAAGEMTYVDPESGYSVFTELAHKKRGVCCGSGCRHCPFSHENVNDKANRIQQPAFLHNGASDLFSNETHDRFKVLFFSGGKDSFLTVRALARQYQDSPFGLVLLTTFDAESRVIAHQDVHIDQILRQASHLDISLLGIPMHRASREPYVERIRRGLDVIESKYGSQPAALVFGDLHLEHIRGWRDKELGMSLSFSLPTILILTLPWTCIKRGMHVMVTKPIVQTLEHHQALAKAADEQGVLVAVEVHKRLDPFYADARDRARSTMGNFQYMYAYMSQPKHQLETFKAWAGKSSDISYYLNSHHVDFSEWTLAGIARPIRVTATGSTGIATAKGMETEDSITLTVQWQNLNDKTLGCAVYTSSWVAPKSDVHSQQRFFYMGTKGEITVDQAHRGCTVATDDAPFASVNPSVYEVHSNEWKICWTRKLWSQEF